MHMLDSIHQQKQAWSIQITGDDSWGYTGVLPYFKRTETFSGTSNDPDARGHEGELRIRKPSYIGLSEDWIRAGQELGYPFVDLNGRHEDGFGILQYPIYKGIRQSTYAAFLLPYHKSPRLTIRRYALVRKLLFRDHTNMVFGVEYLRHGRIETAIATREVILTAGTLGSSKLLMLSGIGPRAHLEELGIPVRSDLPVGHTLQDHLAVPLGPFFIKEPKSFLFDPETSSVYTSSVAKISEGQWKLAQTLTFDSPTVQAIHQGYVDAFAYAYSLQEDELMQYYTNAVGRDSFHINVISSRPTSTGKVLLSGASIDDPLVINPRYLEDPGGSDFKILLEGVKTALTIAHNTSVFQRLGTEFTSTKLPGCQEHDQRTDAYWECYIRRYTLSMLNPVGTAAMMQVVDPSLRVIGTKGLRVMDASVQPTLVSTGTAASTLMIAEKGVDLWLFQKESGLRILQRELDTINPLRALFKPFTALTKGLDSDVKERFTRNGRVDNPFLQVISNVFGNANPNGDISASATTNVGVNIDYGLGQPATLDPSLLQKKSSENAKKSNVISKSQWVLQSTILGTTPSPAQVGSKVTELVSSIASASSSSTTSVLAANEASENGLKITELPQKTTKKGKGGRRFALLQAMLKQNSILPTILQEKVRLTLPSPATTTTTTTTTTSSTTTTTSTTTTVQPTTTTVSTTQSSPSPTSSTTNSTTTSTTPYPVLEDLTFGFNLNSTENEIGIDGIKDGPHPGNKTDNATDAEYIAKSVGVTPSSVLSILQLNNNSSFLHQANPGNTQHTTPDPLDQLLKSLNVFENLMNSLSPSPNNGEATVGTSTTANPLYSPEILNPFGGVLNNLLTVINSTAVTINNGLFTINNTTETINNEIQSNAIVNRNNSSNPFQFLFGNIQSPPAPANNINISSGSNSTTNKESVFSTWFKPLQTNQLTPTSSWFRPLSINNLPPQPIPLPATPSPPPANTWFSPPSNKNYANPFAPTWFNFSNNQVDQLTPNWFKPLPFNAPPSAASTTTPPSPPTSPQLNLFELFLGGLKKDERKTVFKTLDTMFPNQNILNFTGLTTSNTTNSSSEADILAKPISISPASIQTLMDMALNVKNGLKETEKKANMLQTLISVSNLISPQQTPTRRPPNIFDQILSAFNPSATTTAKPPSLLDLFLKG
ncbi:Glucose dehydrogenase [FAD, quinone] [Orchesella cincta]|uniref:Glucose dehydrogenase [FAD, quinone] n=1 Tax=Orchesella cincta TaxID=48709 RepID=A0A1D2MWG0_ORCCI|nr:Glucose dehydrogenase [FAD, quinone] [Orchesella cincta]